MPFAETKCYCTKNTASKFYRFVPTPWDYVCEQHRSEWDTRFIKIFPDGMRDGTDFTLTFNIGFEKFGAYETWGQGWIAEGTVKDKKIWSHNRYMKLAVEAWLKKAESILNEDK